MTSPNAILSDQQIGQIREELQRTLRRVERSVRASAGSRSREIDQSTVGRLSRIEALQNLGFTENLQERERTTLDEVLQALTRIEDGSYGVCHTCRSPIGFERLLVFPEARTCSPCRTVV